MLPNATRLECNYCSLNLSADYTLANITEGRGRVLSDKWAILMEVLTTSLTRRVIGLIWRGVLSFDITLGWQKRSKQCTALVHLFSSWRYALNVKATSLDPQASSAECDCILPNGDMAGSPKVALSQPGNALTRSKGSLVAGAMRRDWEGAATYQSISKQKTLTSLTY